MYLLFVVLWQWAVFISAFSVCKFQNEFYSWSQNIPERSAVILCWWRHVELECKGMNKGNKENEQMDNEQVKKKEMDSFEG